MSDEQDVAEQFDGDALGEDAAADEFPDLDQGGDIGPMSAEDPNVLQADADAPDDERTRAWRERPESDGGGDREQFELVDPAETDTPTLDQQGVEHELAADTVPPDGNEIDAEDAAMHVESD
jgi:hypothetical protein